MSAPIYRMRRSPGLGYASWINERFRVISRWRRSVRLMPIGEEGEHDPRIAWMISRREFEENFSPETADDFPPGFVWSDEEERPVFVGWKKERP